MLVQISGNAALPATALFGMKPSVTIPASAATSFASFANAALSAGISPCAMARAWPTLNARLRMIACRYWNA
jgi:hypothetical protein